MTPPQRKIFTFAIAAALGLALLSTVLMYAVYFTARDQAEIEKRINATPSSSPFITISPQYAPPAPEQDKG
jgi:hypothetical protein